MHDSEMVGAKGNLSMLSEMVGVKGNLSMAIRLVATDLFSFPLLGLVLWWAMLILMKEERRVTTKLEKGIKMFLTAPLFVMIHSNNQSEHFVPEWWGKKRLEKLVILRHKFLCRGR